MENEPIYANVASTTIGSSDVTDESRSILPNDTGKASLNVTLKLGLDLFVCNITFISDLKV